MEPLREALAGLGAVFEEREGRETSVRFEGTEAEVRAARRGPVVADRSFRLRLALTGPDRLSFLQGQITQDVAGLEPGAGAYAFVLDPRGRNVADIRLLVRADDVLLETSPLCAAELRPRLEKYMVLEDVALEDVTPRVSQLLVAGPGTARLLRRVLGVDALAAREDHHVTGSFQGRPVAVQTDLSTGEEGADLFVSPAAAAPLLLALVEGGARAAGYDALEVLRIETGRPRYGVDVTADVLPKETGQEGRAVAYEKGCYTGQEQVAMQHFRGRARKMIRALALEGGDVRPGDAVFAGDAERGRVTSVAVSPHARRPLALALLKGHEHPAGMEVTVRPADGRPDVRGRVAQPPLVAAGGG